VEAQSAAATTVSGAASVLARLPSLIWLTRRSRACAERTSSRRTGLALPFVGAQRIRFQISSICASDTGSGAKRSAVCASRKSRSAAA
jgi:hypothetical protein